MNRKLLTIALSLAFAAMLYAQGEKSVKLNGYLIDNACAESSKDLSTRAKNHSTSCALMDSCEKSGYAVYGEDNKLYKLDEKGNLLLCYILPKLRRIYAPTWCHFGRLLSDSTRCSRAGVW